MRWLLLVVLAGCCPPGFVETPPVRWSASARADGVTSKERDADFRPVKRKYRSALEKLHREVDELVHGRDFADALCRIDALAPGVGGKPVSGCAVLAAYVAGNTYRPRYKSSWRPARETAHTECCSDDSAPTQATIVLRHVTLERIASDSIPARACAANTLAHEWTHLVPNPPRDASAYGDDGHADSDVPLVSYTVGAVVQCLYLQHHGYPGIDLADCVRMVGTTTFNAETCGPEWLP